MSKSNEVHNASDGVGSQMDVESSLSQTPQIQLSSTAEENSSSNIENLSSTQSTSQQQLQPLIQIPQPQPFIVTRNGGYRRYAEDSSTYQNNMSQNVTNKEKAKQMNMVSPTKLASNKTKNPSPENSISKKNKKNEKIEVMRIIEGEIFIDSVNASPVGREMLRSNLHPNRTSATKLEEINWNEMGAIAALGRTLEFLPTDMLPFILVTFIKVLKDSAMEPENMALLKRVFLFPTIVTLKPGVGSLRGNMRQILTEINAENWENQTVGNFEGRIQKMKDKPKKPREKKVNSKTEEEMAHAIVCKRSMKYVHAGEDGRGFKALMNDKSPVKPNLQVVDALKSHQYERNFIDDSNRMNVQIPQSTYRLTADECKKTINGMHSCVAPGYDNLSRNHIKQLIRYKPGVQGEITQADVFLEELTQFINRVLVHPMVPKEVSGYMSGGEMIAPSKDDGSIRPICMIIIITKIVSKNVIRNSKPVLDEIFGTDQVACGMSNGTDKMGHSIRIARELNPEHDFIKSDGDDAFQRLDIDTVLDVIAEDTPDMYEFLESMLNTPKNHVYIGCEEGVQNIVSTQGPGQGLPYASHVFGLQKSRITREAKKILKSGGVSIHMADDNGSVGQSDELMDMTQYVAREGTSRGIIIKIKKYVVLMGERYL